MTSQALYVALDTIGLPFYAEGKSRLFETNGEITTLIPTFRYPQRTLSSHRTDFYSCDNLFDF